MLKRSKDNVIERSSNVAVARSAITTWQFFYTVIGVELCQQHGAHRHSQHCSLVRATWNVSPLRCTLRAWLLLQAPALAKPALLRRFLYCHWYAPSISLWYFLALAALPDCLVW